MSVLGTSTPIVQLRSRAKLALAGLFGIGAIHLLAAGTSIWMLVLLSRAEAGRPVSADSLASLLRLAHQLDTAYWIAFAVCVVTFLIWFYRAFKNVEAMSTIMSGQGASAAIACWFIPFANLVLPYAIAKKIWIGSVHAEEANPEKGMWVVNAWWAAWIVSGLLAYALLRLGGTTDTSFDAVRALQYKAITINAFRALAAVFAGLVVTRITARQANVVAAARVVDAGSARTDA